MCVCVCARVMHLNIVLAGRNVKPPRSGKARGSLREFRAEREREIRARRSRVLSSTSVGRNDSQRTSTGKVAKDFPLELRFSEQSRLIGIQIFLIQANRWREKYERCTGGIREEEPATDGGDATGRREHDRRPAGRVKSLEDRIVFPCVCVYVRARHLRRGFRLIVHTVAYARYAHSMRYLFRYASPALYLYGEAEDFHFFPPRYRR